MGTFVVALMLSQAPMPAPLDLRLPVAAIVIGQGADTVTTCVARQRGLYEGNHRIYGSEPSCLRLSLTKGAFMALEALIVHAANKQGRGKEARVIAYIAGGIGAAAAVWNIHLIRKVKK